MVAVIFVPKHLVMFTVMYETNTGHRAVSLYNESNTQNKFTFKFWSCYALMLCTNFEVFAHFALQSSPMRLYFWYLSCKHFPENTHQYILFAPLFLHLKHFEASALLCVVKGILLDIGRNLWHSLVLQSQIGNFPYSLKKSFSCVKLFSLKNFALSVNEAPKAHSFCFLLLIQHSAVQ